MQRLVDGTERYIWLWNDVIGIEPTALSPKGLYSPDASGRSPSELHATPNSLPIGRLALRPRRPLRELTIWDIS